MKLKWINRMSVGAAIAVLTAFFVVGCGSTEKQNNGSLSTDSSQDISEVSTKQEVLEKSEVPQKSADELKREKVEQYLADMTTEESHGCWKCDPKGTGKVSGWRHGIYESQSGIRRSDKKIIGKYQDNV